jgi:hypothetical protein
MRKLDYAVICNELAIIVTEVKWEAIAKGIAQNVVQFHTASVVSKIVFKALTFTLATVMQLTLSLSKKLLGKRKYDESTKIIYGIVTTGNVWFLFGGLGLQTIFV